MALWSRHADVADAAIIIFALRTRRPAINIFAAADEYQTRHAAGAHQMTPPPIIIGRLPSPPSRTIVSRAQHTDDHLLKQRFMLFSRR